MNKITRLCFLYIVSCFMLSTNVMAEANKPQLKRGLGFYEVLKLWGRPQFKSQKSVKHESIWGYKEGELVFKNGKLVSFPNTREQYANDQEYISRQHKAIEEDWGSVVPPQDNIDIKPMLKKIAEEEEKKAESNLKAQNRGGSWNSSR